MYNSIVGGVNPDTLLVLSLVGLTPDVIPRFRDCSIDEDAQLIRVFTRCGGSNRPNYEQALSLIECSKFYVSTEDYKEDDTYMTMTFKVPDKYKDIATEVAKLTDNRSGETKLDEALKLLEENPDEYFSKNKQAQDLMNNIAEAINSSDSNGAIYVNPDGSVDKEDL